jgi:hypothetical protein
MDLINDGLENLKKTEDMILKAFEEFKKIKKIEEKIHNHQISINTKNNNDKIIKNILYEIIDKIEKKENENNDIEYKSINLKPTVNDAISEINKKEKKILGITSEDFLNIFNLLEDAQKKTNNGLEEINNLVLKTKKLKKKKKKGKKKGKKKVKK